MTSKRIFQSFLFLNVFVIFYGYVLGFGKSLWLDELLSIIFGRELSDLNLVKKFTIDPHAPFFYFLLNFFQFLLKIFNISVNDNINLLKLINLIGFIPLLLSYQILKKEKIQIDINVVFLLLISSNYFIFYILDLRPYFLLLSFTFLIGVINLTNTLEEKHKYLFIISAIILSIFQIYGLTISMSILLYRSLLNFNKKNFRKLRINIYFMILLFIIFFLSYFLQIINPETMSTLGYMQFKLWFVRAFLEWTINTVIFLFFSSLIIIFINIRKKLNINLIKDLFKNNIFINIMGQVLPIIILLFVVLIGSLLIKPIIHFRPLIVIYPSLVLTAGLLAHTLFKNNQYKILLIVFLIIVTFINVNFYLKNIINTQQNIEWVVKKTFTKDCKNSDVYFNDDGKKDMLKYVNQIVEIYSENLRPIKPLSSFNLSKYKDNKKIYESCKVLIFSFHTYNLEKNLSKIDYKNLEFEVNYAPNVVNEETSKAGAIVLVEQN